MNRKMAAATLLLLASCGGGSEPPVTIPENRAPQFTSSSSVSLVENAALSYQAAASDADGDPLTYSIAGGPDAARFSITGAGLLNFLVAPDFDNPADADGNNVYQATLSVSDGRTTTSLPLTMTVTNSREGIAVRRVFSGFSQPVSMSEIPGDTRLFVAERDSDIYYFDPATGTRTFYARIPTPPDGFLGLNFITASPGYASDGLLYVSTGVDRVHVRALVRANVEAGNPGNVIEVSNFRAGSSFNPPKDAGWMGFGPDGHLYLATGGSYERLNLVAHEDGNFTGKLIRIRRNPTPGAPPQFSYELAAKGLFIASTATFSGNMFLIGDQDGVGDAPGEINRLDINGPLVSFGWPYFAGHTQLNYDPPPGLVTPILEIAIAPAPESGGAPEPKTGHSLILGPVYNGPIASLAGQLIFGSGDPAGKNLDDRRRPAAQRNKRVALFSLRPAQRGFRSRCRNDKWDTRLHRDNGWAAVHPRR
jgi:hypothetical protein